MKNKLFVNLCCALITLIYTSSSNVVIAEEEGPEVYQQEIQPMKTIECARCHPAVFTDIRDKGGKHQIACRKCHDVFHTYRPDKDWKDVVPACATCHKEYHGKHFPDCLRCHENAHAPAHDMSVNKMAADCGTCHPAQLTECGKYPSAHTDVSCAECHHTSHGHIPGCTDCHEKPHAAGMDDAGCMACHPPHSPLEVSYSEDVLNHVCAGCHSDVADKLSRSGKGHVSLLCVFCHPQKHGHIPDCKDCHKTIPHSEKMMEQFEGCLDCHGDAHGLNLEQ